MQEVILKGFRLIQDPMTFKDRNGKPYFLFSICSLDPAKNGRYLTCSCSVHDKWIFQKIEEMKLHKGSCVDIMAEILPYEDKDGRSCLSYEISMISFAKFPEKTVKAEETQMKEAEKKTDALIDMLSKENFQFV